MDMKIIAFIPARGGSKGISGKNLVELNGKPLIGYTIDLVKSLGELVIPFLSTDSPEIKKVSERLGLECQYMRPEELAGDTSSTIDAVFHGLEWYHENTGEVVDAVLLLQPTSPIRKTEEVKSAIQKFTDNHLKSLVSVTDMREHPFECTVSEDNSWQFLAKPSEAAFGRQAYKGNFYFLDGSFYLATVKFLKENRSFVKEGETFLFKSSLRYSIDIDEWEDLKVAESILARNSTK
jgi:CMP-N,N'-diacetyllegionaminic acid synthase